MFNIEDKSKCSGCGACYSVCPKNCITMDEDEEGFMYPKVNKELCISCGLCEKVCPRVDSNNEKNSVIRAYVVQHKDEDILRESTSGGGFSPVAEYVLEQGGVVFGVEMQKDDFFVNHIRIEKVEDLSKFRSSKYVQSYIGNTFKEAKKELVRGRLVCFSGTPCQIQGFKNYLRQEYDNLITVDVVCRGVPSPGVWNQYVDYLKNKGEIKEIVFRDKGLGYQYSTMKVEYVNGKIDRNGIESDQWLRMFFSGMILRPSCPTCNFRSIERCSDFTIWDCFNVSDLTSELDETKGATKMIIHTEKGYKVFEQINKAFNVVSLPLEVISAEIKQTAFEHDKKNSFMMDYKRMSMAELVNKWVPVTPKIMMKKYIRRLLNVMGLDLLVKKTIRKIKRKGFIRRV